VKELKNQIAEQLKEKNSFVFDSKIAGKLLVQDGNVTQLATTDDLPTFDFNFNKICD
jgi:hypothetical protein